MASRPPPLPVLWLHLGSTTELRARRAGPLVHGGPWCPLAGCFSTILLPKLLARTSCPASAGAHTHAGGRGRWSLAAGRTIGQCNSPSQRALPQSPNGDGSMETASCHCDWPADRLYAPGPAPTPMPCQRDVPMAKVPRRSCDTRLMRRYAESSRGPTSRTSDGQGEGREKKMGRAQSSSDRDRPAIAFGQELGLAHLETRLP